MMKSDWVITQSLCTRLYISHQPAFQVIYFLRRWLQNTICTFGETTFPSKCLSCQTLLWRWTARHTLICYKQTVSSPHWFRCFMSPQHAHITTEHRQSWKSENAASHVVTRKNNACYDAGTSIWFFFYLQHLFSGCSLRMLRHICHLQMVGPERNETYLCTAQRQSSVRNEKDGGIMYLRKLRPQLDLQLNVWKQEWALCF